MVNAVVLITNGDIKDVNLVIKSSQLGKDINKIITNAFVKKYINDLGSGKIQLLETWNIEEDKLCAYGYTSGKLENNHELPPSVNIKDTVFYGDILVIKKTNNENIVSLTSENYEQIYNKLFGNLGDSDEDINSEYSEYDSNLSSESDDDDSDNDDSNLEDSDNDNEDSDEDQNNYDLEEMETDLYGEESNIEKYGKKTYKKMQKKKKWSLDVNEKDEPTLEDYENNEYISVENIDSNVNIRDEVIKILNTILPDTEKCKIIENSIYTVVCKTCEQKNIVKRWENVYFKKAYMNKVRSIYSNIKTDSYIKNDYLNDKINKNEICLDEIANLSFPELFPKRWKIYVDIKTNKNKKLFENKQEAMTDQFKCGRCKSRKCTYYELQTRSADEGMTIFVTCLDCGARWKQ